MPSLPRIFSDMNDSVAQRTLVTTASQAEVEQLYIDRINFNRFLGYEPLYTDANIFDGPAFQVLFEMPDWTTRIKRFGVDGRHQGSGSRLVVACREPSLTESLVSAIRGGGTNLSGFAVSLIQDDEERVRFSKFCGKKSVDSVEDLPGLIKLVECCASDSILAQDTAERLTRHWRICDELPNITPVRQNEGSKKFRIHDSCRRMVGYPWNDVPIHWEEVSGGNKMSKPALDYWGEVSVNNLDRSKADGIYQAIADQLGDIDKDLLTLHSYFFNRAYNREIARCNDAAFNENVSIYTHPITEEERAYDNHPTKNRPGITVNFVPEAFASLVDVDQRKLDEILKNSGFDSWIRRRDVSALQESLNALGSLIGLSKPPQWLLSPVRFCTQLLAGGASLWFLKYGEVHSLFPDERDIISDLAAATIGWTAMSVANKGLAMMYTIERLKRDIVLAGRIADADSPT